MLLFLWLEVGVLFIEAASEVQVVGEEHDFGDFCVCLKLEVHPKESGWSLLDFVSFAPQEGSFLCNAVWCAPKL